MAAAYRDALRTVEDVAERQVVQSLKGENVDVFGFFESGQDVAVVVLVVRGGVLQDRRDFFFEKAQELEPAAFLEAFLPQFYDANPFLPVRGPPAGRDRGPGAPRGVPGRAPRREGRGPRSAARRRRPTGCGWRRSTPGSATGSASAATGGDEAVAAERLGRAIGLAMPPHRIEAFDISHTQGTDSVASMVVFEDGRPKKSEYRLFNIAAQELLEPDDFRSMAEAVERRYRRVQASEGPWPDLVLVDGGRGQLQAALTALDRIGVELPAVGLAKREEEIWVPDRPDPIRLSRKDPALQLIQRARDEAHRFAISRHRRRRGKRMRQTSLTEIPGVGPTRARLLLRRFGSVQGLRGADPGEIAAAVGPGDGARRGRLSAALRHENRVRTGGRHPEHRHSRGARGALAGGRERHAPVLPLRRDVRVRARGRRDRRARRPRIRASTRPRSWFAPASSSRRRSSGSSAARGRRPRARGPPGRCADETRVALGREDPRRRSAVRPPHLDRGRLQPLPDRAAGGGGVPPDDPAPHPRALPALPRPRPGASSPGRRRRAPRARLAFRGRVRHLRPDRRRRVGRPPHRRRVDGRRHRSRGARRGVRGREASRGARHARSRASRLRRRGAPGRAAADDRSPGNASRQRPCRRIRRAGRVSRRSRRTRNRTTRSSSPRSTSRTRRGGAAGLGPGVRRARGGGSRASRESDETLVDADLGRHRPGADGRAIRRRDRGRAAGGRSRGDAGRARRLRPGRGGRRHRRRQRRERARLHTLRVPAAAGRLDRRGIRREAAAPLERDAARRSSALLVAATAALLYWRTRDPDTPGEPVPLAAASPSPASPEGSGRDTRSHASAADGRSPRCRSRPAHRTAAPPTPAPSPRPTVRRRTACSDSGAAAFPPRRPRRVRVPARAGSSGRSAIRKRGLRPRGPLHRPARARLRGPVAHRGVRSRPARRHDVGGQDVLPRANLFPRALGPLPDARGRRDAPSPGRRPSFPRRATTPWSWLSLEARARPSRCHAGSAFCYPRHHSANR